MSEPELNLGLWADEDGDTYPVGPHGNGLYLGGITLTVDDLMRMRPWLNSQIEWSESMIQDRWSDFFDDDFEYENEAELATWPEDRQRALLTSFLADWVDAAERNPESVMSALQDAVNAQLPQWAGVFENGEGMWGDCMELSLGDDHTLEDLEAWLQAETEKKM